MDQPESDPVSVSAPIPEESFPQLIWLGMEETAAVARISWRNAPQGDYSLTLYQAGIYWDTRSNSCDANFTEELLGKQMHISRRQPKSETDLAALYRPLRANIDEKVLPVIITEQGENRNRCEEQRNLFGFSYGLACRGT